MRNDSRVVCWGRAIEGQLGYGNTLGVGDNELPVSAGLVDTGGPVVSIATGGYHSCALRNDSKVICWGYAAYGELGYNGTATIGDDEVPASAGPVDVGGAVAIVAAGHFHTCAVRVDGRLLCWGLGALGRLGYGNTNSVGTDNVPVSAGPVSVGGSVLAVSGGLSHTCIVRNDSQVMCWGLASNGQLGYGNKDNVGDDELPVSAGVVDVGGLVSSIATGNLHSCAVRHDGAVLCWGLGQLGQLGYKGMGDIGDDELPVTAGPVVLGGPVQSISAGSHHTCAVRHDGQVFCWGSSRDGQLGYGTTDDVGIYEVPASVGTVSLA